MKRLYIIKVGTTFADTAREFGDFDQWTFKGLGGVEGEIAVVDAEHGAPLPAADECSGVVVTGSHDMVTDNLPWSVKVAQWIFSLMDLDVPFLGICYGHQLLAHAMGGEIGFHPKGEEIGTVDIQLLPASFDDMLFFSLPPSFPAHVSHAQTVISLPQGAIRLAMNSFEPTHAFRLGRQAWGVQFHPEYNEKIMKSYIINMKDELKEMGKDIPLILNSVKETPVAGSILRRFYRIVKGGVKP